MTDPLRRRRTWDGVAVLASLLGVGAAVPWAFGPLPAGDALTAGDPLPVEAVSAPSASSTSIDLAGFRSADWWPVIEQAKDGQAESDTEPAFRHWTLVGVVHGPGGMRAAFYESEADELFTLGPSEKRGDVEVVEVAEKAVRVRQGERLHCLVLDPGPRRTAGGER